MTKRYQRSIALVVTFTFLALLPITTMPLPAAQAAGLEKEAGASETQAAGFIEKEQQTGYQVSQRNILPIMLGVAAVAAGVFLLVILVSRVKYDVVGVWEFHNDYTTEGDADFDSTWTFTPYYDYDRVIGMYERNANGKITKGQYAIADKKNVVFEDTGVSEQYVGSFNSKTTMSGTFRLASGAKGNWTAKKK